MYPLLRAGTQVALRQVDPRDLRPGDVIAFRRDERIIVHRLIEREMANGNCRLREKGDNVATSTWISDRDVVGKAIWAVRNGERRWLDVTHSSRLLRWLTAGSRLEAEVVERLRRVKNVLIGASGAGATRWVQQGISVALLPVKVLVVPLLLAAYQPADPERERRTRHFLLRCFRVVCGTEDAEDLVVPPDLDWAALAADAQAQGIMSQVVPVLAPLARRGELPESVLEDAKRLRYHGAFTHMAGLGTIKDVAETLSDIPYAVIKGPAVALLLYNENEVRHYGDVDVVIRKADRDRAIEALSRSRFEVRGGKMVQRLVRAGHFHVVLEPQSTARLKLELHWSLVDRANLYRIDEEEVFAGIRWVESKGLRFSVLSLSDELIYLCIHVVKHGVLNGLGLKNKEDATWFCGRMTDNRLAWFLDIHRLLKRYAASMDWDALREKAERWNTWDEVVQTLAVLNVLVPGSEAAEALRRLGVPEDGPPVAGWALMGRLYRTRLGQFLIEKCLVCNPDLTLRPVRFLFLGRLLFPPPRDLLRYYGKTRLGWWPLLFLFHPANILRKQIS